MKGPTTQRGKCPKCGGPASKCATVIQERPLVFDGRTPRADGKVRREREMSRYFYCEMCGHQEQAAMPFRP